MPGRGAAAGQDESGWRDHLLIESLPAAIYACDRDGYLTRYNNAAVSLWGRRPVLGVDRWSGCKHLFWPDGKPCPLEESAIARALREKTGIRNEDMIVEQADGTRRSVTMSVEPMVNDGQVVGAVGTLIEVDDVSGAQLTRESETRFRRMADEVPVPILMHGPQGCEFVNREYLRFVGGTLDEQMGANWRRFIHPDDVERCVADYRQAFAREEPFETEFRLRRSDGQYRTLRSSAAPRHSNSGVFQGHVGCAIDVTDITRSQEMLRESARRKDEFLATLAHELRNPLAPIRNSLRALRLSKGAATPDRLYAILDRQVDHLVRLVDDLMAMSRITRGKFELRRERVDLSAIVNIAIETSQPLIDYAGHRLTVRLPSESPVLHADAVRLVQVFANLLSNAARYTEPGGRIWVTAHHQNGEVVVAVKDTGIGMLPETLGKIFDLFVQGADSIGTRKGGLGIGLTLVRRIVEMHGGQVHATSDGPGQGSEFVVTLPALGTAADVEVRGIHDEVRSGGSIEGRRVLVVDDHRDGADSLAMMLEMLGATVRVAYEGGIALEALASFKPDTVLLDIGMPGMNGYEVAHRIREGTTCADVLLIALTGWGQDEDRRRSLEAGFDFHLVKPLETDTLRTVLASADLLRGMHQRAADRLPPP
jgi:PAS domain S-box-containing protein